MRFLLLTLAFALPCAAQINQALWSDPKPDLRFPAHNVEMAVPSHDEILLGAMLLAAGDKPHPTAVLLHGFPGYEQNLDLAQSLRRAGWNVLALHYRGSWGVGGIFSFTHAIEDADAMVDFVLTPATAAKYHIDPKHVVVLGHSMGGFMAMETMAHHPQLTAAVVLTESNPATDAAAYTMPPEDLYPLHGTSVAALKQEAAANLAAWDYKSLVPKIAPRPVLVLSTEDGLQNSNQALADALKKAGSTKAQLIHLDSDHAFATRRVAVQSIVVDWLTRN